MVSAELEDLPKAIEIDLNATRPSSLLLECWVYFDE